MRKSQTIAFYFYFFVQENVYFLRKHIWKTYFILLHLFYRFFFTWQVIGNTVTPTPMQIFIGFADAIHRSKILDNRLGILTQILITMGYYFYLYISDIYLQFREKSILIWGINFIIKCVRKRIEKLAKSLFPFFIIVHEVSGYTFYEEKHSLGKTVQFTTYK